MLMREQASAGKPMEDILLQNDFPLCPLPLVWQVLGNRPLELQKKYNMTG
jgi:hypothetical protein